MGTTASMYMEWRKPLDPIWCAEELHVTRNYHVFDALAGGRSGEGFLYPPRGLPHDVSERVLQEACSRIVETDEEAETIRKPCLAIKRNKCWGPPWSEIIRRGTTEYEFNRVGYLHSHSWLTLEEIRASLLRHSIDLEQLNECYSLLLKRMKELEMSGHEVRLIVWFDGGPMDTRRLSVIEAISRIIHKDWRPVYFGFSAINLDIYVSPLFQILSGSRSESELICILTDAEKEEVEVFRSSPEELHVVAVKLLSLDVTL
jgi:hypothetical protein